MKRIIAWILTLAALLSLTACGGPSLAETGEPAPVTTEEEVPLVTKKTKETVSIREEPQGTFDPTGFSVGFGRYQINPPKGSPMAGYGNESMRLSSTVKDNIYATCVAVSDGENTALFFSMDVISIPTSTWQRIATGVEEATGVPRAYQFMTATHTHSGPTTSPEAAGGSILIPRMVKAAKDAIATLDKAEMFIGDTRTQDMAYVRRYLREDGSYVYRETIPSGATAPEYNHETEADNQMQLIRFKRANQKDVLMVNWTCHVTTVGSSSGTEISADWVGAFRDEVESREDVYFAFYQGAAGNVTPGGKLATDKQNAADHVQHGKDLAEFCLAALPSLTQVEPGKVRAMESIITCSYDTDVSGYDLAGAQEIQDRFASSGSINGLSALCKEKGYASVYHARSVLTRSKYEPGKTANMNLVVIAIGDVAFAGAPFEMFDTSGMQIKSASPYTMTFMSGYTNGSFGYIPNQEVFPNHQYEVDTCKFVPGTAEQVVAELLRLLGEMK